MQNNLTEKRSKARLGSVDGPMHLSVRQLLGLSANRRVSSSQSRRSVASTLSLLPVPHAHVVPQQGLLTQQQQTVYGEMPHFLAAAEGLIPELASLDYLAPSLSPLSVSNRSSTSNSTRLASRVSRDSRDSGTSAFSLISAERHPSLPLIRINNARTEQDNEL